MKNVFTIDNETSSITIHNSVKEAEAVPNTERFSSEAALLKLAVNWPAARLVEIWNSLPGETPVKRFKDRATAVSRIWKVIQSLGQTPSAAIEDPAPLSQSETIQVEPVIAESTEPAPATNVGAQAPAVAPAEPGSTKRPPARRKRTRHKRARRARAARPAS